MRTPLLPVASFLGFMLCAALASSGCGGRAVEFLGDGGPGGGSGSSSGVTGSSSSGGGGSSGGSSSGASSGGSSSSGSGGSSSGAPIPCSPEPPSGSCKYLGETCDYNLGGPCSDESCTCDNGEWACAISVCSPPPLACPPYPPAPGDTCSVNGASCGWTGQGGGPCGGEDCTCENGYWACSGQGCPPPSCPPAPPGNGDSCYGIGSVCDYPINNNVCGTWECDCYPSGTYSCYETNCYGYDGGVADAGFGGD